MYQYLYGYWGSFQVLGADEDADDLGIKMPLWSWGA